MIPKVKGTHDLLDLTLYNFCLAQIAEHLARYHFTQIQTPILEHTELFKRTLGVQTDVVSKEMFIISPKNHDEHESFCLRPEATASTMRAFLEHGIEQLPWKVFLYGPMFRYERPQKGRFREFHQASMEIIGSASIAEDAHFIKMLDRLFAEKFGLSTYALSINFLGTQEDRQRYKEKLFAFVQKNNDQICANCTERKEKNLLRILDCKNEQCKKIYAQAPKTTDHLSAESAQEWEQLQTQLQLLSVSFSHNPMLVRGLDYYDKTAFEFVSDNLGAQSAFCGGGRYNRLATELGAKEPVPALGAAIGLERLMLLLEPLINQLPIPQQKALQVIIPFDKEQESLALMIADHLQAHELTVELLLDGSFKSRMRKAHKMGAAHVLLLGSDEQAAHSVTIKNMITGDQQLVKQVDAVAYLKK